MLKRSWFEIVEAVPADCQWVRRWDLASVAGGGDFTAGALMGWSKSTQLFYIKNILRDQLSGDEVKKLIKQTAAMDALAVGKRNYSVWISEDPGQAGKVQANDFINMLAGYDVHTEKYREADQLTVWTTEPPCPKARSTSMSPA